MFAIKINLAQNFKPSINSCECIFNAYNNTSVTYEDFSLVLTF